RALACPREGAVACLGRAVAAADMAAAEWLRTRAGPPMRMATTPPTDRTVIGRDIGDALLSICGRFAPPPTQYVLIQISEILLLAVKAGFPPCSALPPARL